jgi:hypothetical protein
VAFLKNSDILELFLTSTISSGTVKDTTEDIRWILEDQDYPRLWWELIPEN